MESDIQNQRLIFTQSPRRHEYVDIFADIVFRQNSANGYIHVQVERKRKKVGNIIYRTR